MRRITTSAVLGAILATSAWQVVADDLIPPPMPPWPTRVSPGRVFADFTFTTIGSPVGYYATFDAGLNPYGPSTATVTDGQWLADVAGHLGVWSNAQNIAVTLANGLDDNPKYAWLQLTWTDPDPTTVDRPSVVVNPATGAGGQVVLPLFSESTLQNGCTHSIFALPGSDILSPGSAVWDYNPGQETFTVSTAGLCIDQIVVDTYCPEPGQVATMVLTSLGAAGYGLRRYQGRKQS